MQPGGQRAARFACSTILCAYPVLQTGLSRRHMLVDDDDLFFFVFPFFLDFFFVRIRTGFQPFAQLSSMMSS